MKTFIFTSGIRKITILASTLDQAKEMLTFIEPDALTDQSWNWKIYVK